MTPPLVPPRIEPPTPGKLSPLPGLVFGGLLLALAGARSIATWQVPLPRCLFRELTGLPCAFCGGTHCLIAAAHGNFRAACAWNPLVFLGGVGLAAWFGGWLFAVVTGWRPPPAWARSLQTWPWPWLLVAAIALNWLYLGFCFPR